MTLASLGPVEHDIRFGVGGNAASYRMEGWSFPEPGFMWTVGKCSRLRLPSPSVAGDGLLILEGRPYLSEPNLLKQAVQIVISGIRIANFTAHGEFTRCFRIQEELLGEGAVLELHHPDAASPSSFGSADIRHLGVAWRRIRVLRVPKARLMREVDGGNGAASIKPLASSKKARPQTRTGHRLADADTVLSPQAQEDAVLALFCSGQLADVGALLGEGEELSTPALSLTSDLPVDISLVRCTMDRNGKWRFEFPEIWASSGDAFPAARMVVRHFLAVLPLFAAYAQAGRIPGSVMLNLGDEAHARGLAFCAQTSDVLLLPDPYFMRSRGYHDLRISLARADVPYSSRKSVALWRGNPTGYRGPAGLLGLGRVRLCMLGQQPENRPYMDVGLTGTAQLASQAEIATMTRHGLFADFVAPERLVEWKFHIDIDGNTNSWPGLFQKLLSGGVVLKVASARSWRQWYYDRLEPFVNLMPVASDLSDLNAKIKYLAYNESIGSEIAQNCKKLVQSISYDEEVYRALGTIEDAVVQEQLLEDTRMEAQNANAAVSGEQLNLEIERRIWGGNTQTLDELPSGNPGSWGGSVQAQLQVFGHMPNLSMQVAQHAAVPTLAALTLVKDEADIIGLNLEWLHSLGVRRFVILNNASTDGTADVIRRFVRLHQADTDLELLTDNLVAHLQAQKMTFACHRAMERWPDLTWLLPFDADEFLQARSGFQALMSVPPHVEALSILRVIHFRPIGTADPDQLDWEGLAAMSVRSGLFAVPPKVILRASSRLSLGKGNHWVQAPESETVCYGGGLTYGIFTREFQTRSFAQFHSKVRNGGRALRAAQALGDGMAGDHWLKWEGILINEGEAALREEYQKVAFRQLDAHYHDDRFIGPARR